MRLRTPDARAGEGVNKWQRTGINDGLLTPIAPAAEAAPVSLPEGRAPPRKADLLYAITVAALIPRLASRRSGASPSDDPDWSHKM
jgi:hypothetical protein